VGNSREGTEEAEGLCLGLRRIRVVGHGPELVLELEKGLEGRRNRWELLKFISGFSQYGRALFQKWILNTHG